MEILHFEFQAGETANKSITVGCVGSGDLEILLQPNTAGTAKIQVTTSVDGSSVRWKNLFERVFSVQVPPAANIQINDFGATPGVVRLRLEQAFEEVKHG
nr:malonate decarboxylase subunit delta [Acinetobacter sp. Marseille-Q1620]